MPKCPRCQTVNAEDSLLCSRCGHSLSPGFASGTQTATSPTPAGPAQPLSSFAPPAPCPAAAPPLIHAVQEGTPYRSSGRVEIAKLPVLLLGGLVAAVLVGLIYGFITNFFSLIVLFPMIGGACTGFVIFQVNSTIKNRNVPVAALVGLVAGFLTMGISEFTHAWMERPAAIEAYTDYLVQDDLKAATGKSVDPSTIPPAQLQKLRDAARVDVTATMTPWVTLEQYEINSAAQGTTIKRNGVGTGTTISGNSYWFLQGLEFLILMMCCAAISASSAQRPFCENCALWHKQTDIMKVHPMQNAHLLEKVANRDWAGLLGTPVGAAIDNKNATMISVSRCESCGQGTLKISSTTPIKFERQNLAPASTKALLEPVS